MIWLRRQTKRTIKITLVYLCMVYTTTTTVIFHHRHIHVNNSGRWFSFSWKNKFYLNNSGQCLHLTVTQQLLLSGVTVSSNNKKNYMMSRHSVRVIMYVTSSHIPLIQTIECAFYLAFIRDGSYRQHSRGF